MIIAVMQPYFFPYIAYWQLYYCVDKWVILDEVQFRKFSWMRRNRILHDDRNKETRYINLPVRKHGQKIRINEVQVNNDAPWREEIRNRLRAYQRLKARHYPQVSEMLDKMLDKTNADLIEVMTNTFRAMNDYLGMETEYLLSSDVEFDRRDVTAPDEWSLRIAAALGADTYINLPGGKDLYQGDKYRSNGVELLFLKPAFREYPQADGLFIPGLSILDVLMFNSVEAIRDMLKSDYRLLPADAVVCNAGGPAI